MMFYLSKAIYFFLAPINWVLLCFALYFIFRKKAWRKYCIPLGISILVLFSNPFVFNIVCKGWEGKMVTVDSMENHYDYIILLGGFSSYNKQLGHQYISNERGNRLIATLQLYRARKGKKILMSGGSGNIWEKTPSEAILTKGFLLEMGISEMDILLEPDSRNTYENALFTKRLLNQILPDAKCLLVTSAFHMRRARALFKNQGIDVTPYPTDFISETPNRPRSIFLPSGKILWKWEALIKEWVGIFVYWLKGDI